MPKLYVTELQTMANANDIGGLPQIAMLPSQLTQAVTYSGTSVQSSPFGANTRFIRVHTDAACHVVVGANPTSTTNSLRMAADQTEYFGVLPGQRISVIQG